MRDNVGKWIVKSRKVKEKMFTLSDVKAGASYKFRVSAVSKAGQGPASATSPLDKYGQHSSRFMYILLFYENLMLNYGPFLYHFSDKARW